MLSGCGSKVTTAEPRPVSRARAITTSRNAALAGVDAIEVADRDDQLARQLVAPPGVAIDAHQAAATSMPGAPTGPTTRPTTSSGQASVISTSAIEPPGAVPSLISTRPSISGCLASMAPLEQMLALGADALDQDLETATHQALPAGQGDRPLRLEQPLMPAASGGAGHTSAEFGGRRALFRAVDKRPEMIETRPADELQQMLEVLAALARETDDEGRAQPDLGHQLARSIQQPQVAAVRAATPHRPQELGMAVLQRHVEIGDKAVLGRHEPQETVVESRRIGVEEADPGKLRAGQQRLDQPPHAGAPQSQILAVARGVLGDQAELAYALLLEPPGLGHQVRHRAAAEPTAPQRDSAEGTWVVAALGHLEIGVAAGRQLARRGVVEHHVRRPRRRRFAADRDQVVHSPQVVEADEAVDLGDLPLQLAAVAVDHAAGDQQAASGSAPWRAPPRGSRRSTPAWPPRQSRRC